MNLHLIALALLVLPASTLGVMPPKDTSVANSRFKPKLPSEGKVIMATTDLALPDANHWEEAQPGDVENMVWLRHEESSEANPLLIGWSEAVLEPDNKWVKWVDGSQNPLEPENVGWCWDTEGLGKVEPLFAYDKDLGDPPTNPPGPFKDVPEGGSAFIFVLRHTPTESEADAYQRAARETVLEVALPAGPVMMGWTGKEEPDGWRFARTNEQLKKRYLYKKGNKKRPLLIGWLGRGLPAGGQWLNYAKKLKKLGWIYKKGATEPMKVHPWDKSKPKPRKYKEYKKLPRWIIRKAS